MILSILFGVWLLVAIVTFAMQFDPDDWVADAALALVLALRLCGRLGDGDLWCCDRSL